METIKKMYQHLAWANDRILSRLQTIEQTHEINDLFAHILLAEQTWFYRLENKDSSHITLWGETSLQTCEQLASNNKEEIEGYLNSLEESDLQTLVSYKNSKGQQFQTSVHDILTHVALHGQYHRGQINKLLRTAGNEPVNVDYITWIRNEF